MNNNPIRLEDLIDLSAINSGDFQKTVDGLNKLKGSFKQFTESVQAVNLSKLREDQEALAKSMDSLAKETNKINIYNKDQVKMLSQLHSLMSQYEKSIQKTIDTKTTSERKTKEEIALVEAYVLALNKAIKANAEMTASGKEDKEVRRQNNQVIKDTIISLNSLHTAEKGNMVEMKQHLNDLIKLWYSKGEAFRKANGQIGDEIKKTREMLNTLHRQMTGQYDEDLRKDEERIRKSIERHQRKVEIQEKNDLKAVNSAVAAAEKKKKADDNLRMRQEANGAARAAAIDREFRAEVGSINKLEAELNELTERWRMMGEAARKANSNIPAEINAIKSSLKSLHHEINPQSDNGGGGRGGYGVAGMINSYFGPIAAIYAAISGIKKAFDVAVKFDAIEQSLGAISRSHLDLAFNMQYTKDLASKLGLEYENLVGSYKNFSVALMDTNLEGQRTRDIFTAVSKAATVMKLPTESVQGVFLALEQIASKGTVSMEELRKQLGNRLPGAFNLFAEGLNLSTKELNDFVKTGRITKDALVPFAEMLEKKFGDKVGSVTNSLPAQMNRITNSFKSLAQTKGVIEFFKGVADGVLSFANALKWVFTPTMDIVVEDFKKFNQKTLELNERVSTLLTTYDSLRGKAKLNADEHERLKSTINDLTAIFPAASTGFDVYGNSIDINRKKVVDFTAAQNEMNKTMRLTAEKKLKESIMDDISRGSKALGILSKGEGTLTPNAQSFFTSNSIAPTKTLNPDGTFSGYGEGINKVLQEARASIVEKSRQLLEIGGTLDKFTVKALDNIQVGLSEDLKLSAKKTEKVNELNRQIERLNTKAALELSDKQKRNELISERDKLEIERQELLYPGSTARKDYDPFQDPKKKKEKRDMTMQDKLRLERELHDQKIIEARQIFDDSKQSFNDKITWHDMVEKEEARHYEASIKIIKDYGAKSKETEDELERRRVDLANHRDDGYNKVNEARRKDLLDMKKYNEEMYRLIVEQNKRLRELAESEYRGIEEINKQQRNSARDIRKAKRWNPFSALFGGGGTPNIDFKEDQSLRQERIDDLQSRKERANVDLFNSIELQQGLEGKVALNRKRRDKLAEGGQEESPEELFQSQKDEGDLNKAISDRTKQQNDLTAIDVALKKERGEKLTAEEQRQKDGKIALAVGTAKAISDIANSELDAQKKRIQTQMDNVQGLANFEMQLAGNNSLAKIRIAQREQNEMRKLRREMAQKEKTSAMFSATLSMAQGIAAATAVAPPYGFILAAMVAAASLKQISDISSQALPAYKKGRKGGKKELAEVGEEGFELGEHNGKFRILNHGITELKENETVHTHKESLTLLGADNYSKNLSSNASLISDVQRKDKMEMYRIIAGNMVSKKDFKEAIVDGLKEMPTPVIHLPAQDVQDRHTRQQLRNGL